MASLQTVSHCVVQAGLWLAGQVHTPHLAIIIIETLLPQGQRLQLCQCCSLFSIAITHRETEAWSAEGPIQGHLTVSWESKRCLSKLLHSQLYSVPSFPPPQVLPDVSMPGTEWAWAEPGREVNRAWQWNRL